MDSSDIPPTDSAVAPVAPMADPAASGTDPAAQLARAKELAARTPLDWAMAHWPSIPPRPYAAHPGRPADSDEAAARMREVHGPDGGRIMSPNGPGPDAYAEGRGPMVADSSR